MHRRRSPPPARLCSQTILVNPAAPRYAPVAVLHTNPHVAQALPSPCIMTSTTERCTSPARYQLKMLRSTMHHRHPQADAALTPPASSLYAHPRCPTWLAALRPTSRASSWHVSIAASIVHGGGDCGLRQACLKVARGAWLWRHGCTTTKIQCCAVWRCVVCVEWWFSHHHCRACGGPHRRDWLVACRCRRSVAGHRPALRGQCRRRHTLHRF